MKHNFRKIEGKWQQKWEDAKIFNAVDGSPKKKFYGLVEFPYPSGAGMHVGHIKAYSSLEVISRKRRMEGYNVLFPIGFDAFGLPTENYAIKTGKHPRVITDENIARFTNQLKKVGFSFDWDRVIDTTDEDYYKWTQWIFLKMYEHGLVFRSKALVNYCPSCKVVLSNEDSQGGHCDICHSEVVQKSKDVWYLRITEYADKLLAGLEDVDYPANVKQQQVNWIGKSTGAFVDFKIDGVDEQLEIYTTRPDTLFGVTFMVMAPEHPLIDKYADRISNMDAIKAYRTECAKKTEFERTQLVKDKTGVKIEGLEAVNPVNGKKIPIFIADYVMMGYGTGAIMAVPAHDERDWEFAKKFNMPIIEVVAGGDVQNEVYTDVAEGTLVNSGFLNGLSVAEAKKKILEWLEENHVGKAKTNYKLRDWVFSRQRYWGEPIPIVHCDKCGYVPVPEESLPLELPDVESYMPTDNGESPLAAMTDWVNTTCPCCGGPAKRETDTMPQWAGSSWYYIRYTDPKNKEALASKEAMKYWLPVDWYNGGMEHTTLHLLYSRFWHKFLYDQGVVTCPEPYQKRTSHGMILGENGEKMSKSRGNVVNPDDIVAEFGADTLRTYEMFIGAFDLSASWSQEGVKGCRRFLERVWKLQDSLVDGDSYSKELESKMHQTIKKVSSDYESLKYNTAIAAMMTLVNEFYKAGKVTRKEFETLLILLNPVAPHMTEELWADLGYEGRLYQTAWPEFDEEKTVEAVAEIAVQINGKMRGTIKIAKDADKETAIAAAKEAVADKLTGNIVKEIYVPGRIVNIVQK